jgi:hypothetical protein
MIVVAMEPKILQEPICNATKIQGFWYHENILTQCLCSKQRNFSTPKAIDKSATILRER